MADYPDIVQVIGSQFVGDDGTVMERSVSGKPRLRSFFTDVQYMGQLIHEVDGPEKELVRLHHLAHRALAFNVLYRGDQQTYVCRYLGPPEYLPIAGVDRWRVTSKFVVVGT